MTTRAGTPEAAGASRRCDGRRAGHRDHWRAAHEVGCQVTGDVLAVPVGPTVVLVEAAKLAALLALRDELERLHTQGGHITRADVGTALDTLTPDRT